MRLTTFHGVGVETAPIGELEEDNISRTITLYVRSQTLHAIALCYHDLRSWPPKVRSSWTMER